MSYKSTRIMLLGKKTKDGKTLQEFMSETFPVEVPVEYIFSIKVTTGKEEVLELDPEELITPIDLQDLSSFYKNYRLSEHINIVEIILDLQAVEDKMLVETSSFIDKIFPKDE